LENNRQATASQNETPTTFNYWATMNRIWIVGSLVVASLTYNIYQGYRIEAQASKMESIEIASKKQIGDLQMLTQFNAGREAINDDNFRDVLMTQMSNSNLENQKNQGRIEGILAVIGKQKPDESEWSSIWHEGYNRGLAQSKDFTDVNSYQKGREDALKDAKEGKTGQIYSEGEKNGYLVGYHKAQEDQAAQVCPVTGGYVNTTKKSTEK
jgi:hypothetical protein